MLQNSKNINLNHYFVSSGNTLYFKVVKQEKEVCVYKKQNQKDKLLYTSQYKDVFAFPTDDENKGEGGVLI